MRPDLVSDWIEFEGTGLIACDAMEAAIDQVEAARYTEDGIEVICIAVTPEGEEFVMTPDEGVTFEPVRARMDIPGGSIHDLLQED